MTAQLQIHTFVDAQFGENAYVVWQRQAGPCWIIDPGFPPTPDRIRDHVARHDLRPEALILTHGHMDHIAGVPPIREMFEDIVVYMSDQANVALGDPNENLSAGFGLPVVVGDFETVDLPAGGRLELDGRTWELFDTSGHAPGSRSLYCRNAGIVIVGDALFQGSIGRTDFHHSNHAEFIRNIKQNLLTLPDDTIVYSGHGPTTTIGAERQFNPFLQDDGISAEL